jgi:Flp pilus assembly pilin Flp
MSKLFSLLKRLWSDEAGLVTVEYALLVAVIVVGAISIWTNFGLVVRTKVAQASDQINGIH